MASRRRSRFDTVHNPAAVMRALRSCRDAMTEASRHLTIGGPVYQATHAIIGAIDALAFLITGDREYFWEKGGGGLTTEAHLEALRKRTARSVASCLGSDTFPATIYDPPTLLQGRSVRIKLCPFASKDRSAS